MNDNVTNFLAAVPVLRFLIFWLLLFIAAGLQANVSLFLPYAEITGRPDFILTFCLLAALFSDAAVGCGWGLAAGLLTGALAGQTVGSFLVSRTVAGYVSGGFSDRFVRANPVVIVAAVIGGSLAADIVYLLCAPPLRLDTLLAALRFAGMNTLWNAALSLPLAHIMRRLGWLWDEED